MVLVFLNQVWIKDERNKKRIIERGRRLGGFLEREREREMREKEMLD